MGIRFRQLRRHVEAEHRFVEDVHDERRCPSPGSVVSIEFASFPIMLNSQILEDRQSLCEKINDLTCGFGDLRSLDADEYELIPEAIDKVSEISLKFISEQ